MKAPCIRNNSAEPCKGHNCVACGEPHRECTPRAQGVETGIARRQSLAERLADGWKMLDDDHD